MLKIAQALRDNLNDLDRFDSVGAPPEPSNVKNRARWASFKLQKMLLARDGLIGLVSYLCDDGALKKEIEDIRSHVLDVVSNRGLNYVKFWLNERGISWREMDRPQEEFDGLSWVCLLRLNDLEL